MVKSALGSGTGEILSAASGLPNSVKGNICREQGCCTFSRGCIGVVVVYVGGADRREGYFSKSCSISDVDVVFAERGVRGESVCVEVLPRRRDRGLLRRRGSLGFGMTLFIAESEVRL